MKFMDLFKVPSIPGRISGNLVFAIRCPIYKMDTIASVIELQASEGLINNIKFYDSEHGHLIVIIAADEPNAVGSKISKLLTNSCYRYTWAKVCDNTWKISMLELDGVEMEPSKKVLDVYYGDDGDGFDILNSHMKIHKYQKNTVV